ncbi:MAG: class I SAM-dependent methyltransferase [Xanthomonadales bacterium]|nr:class I SAM-dependent methyltransferase [Xanthomonadales bacterium]
MASHLRKVWNRILRKYFGRERAHKWLLRRELNALLERVPDPLVIETGSIRWRDEGTESTLTIAKTLNGRGRFYSFELRPEHIDVSREICGNYDRYVNYVEGDSVANLERLVADGTLSHIDFAFLDSTNSGEHTFKEFSAIEGCFRPGSVLVCDDVLWADKGRLVVPYIQASADWECEVLNVEKGMMVARRLPPPA